MAENTNEGGTKKADRRSYFKRMNTVASTTPFAHQEFALDALDKERERTNAANETKLKLKAREDTVVRQIQSVPAPVRTPLSYAELFVGDKPDYNKLKSHLLKEGKLEKEAAMALVEKVTALFREEPNLLELEAPYTVCGDIHGQFYDLVNLLDNAGDPATTPYLFLGDYVDRGCFSCEVCFLLFSMKINFPKTFYMIRGNHESRAMTNIHNFKAECFKKYDEELYGKFMESFDCLPLAAVLRCRSLGRFFCVHGGLSPDLETLDDIQVLDRIAEVPSDGGICDLLWSDPVLEDEEMSARDILEFRDIDFIDNNERGIGYFFGFKAITQFLLKNNLVSIVRAHEVQQEGCAEHMFTRTDISIPMAFTVFSAPNYCDFYSNKAAFIKFLPNKYEIYQLEWVPHPYWLPDFQNVFAFSIDYVLEAVHTMLKTLAKTNEGEEKSEDWLAESQSQYVQKLAALEERKLRNGKNLAASVAADPNLQNLPPREKFRKIRDMDFQFEKGAPNVPKPGPAKKPADRNRMLKKTVSSIF